jgi:hypothetical protein
MQGTPAPAMAPNMDQKTPDEDTSYVAKLVEYFEQSEEATEEARKLSEQCRDYYDGRQLTASERKALQDRGQPDIVINRIQAKIDYLVGYEASNRTDPRAYPRNLQPMRCATSKTKPNSIRSSRPFGRTCWLKATVGLNSP